MLNCTGALNKIPIIHWIYKYRGKCTIICFLGDCIVAHYFVLDLYLTRFAFFFAQSYQTLICHLFSAIIQVEKSHCPKKRIFMTLIFSRLNFFLLTSMDLYIIYSIVHFFFAIQLWFIVGFEIVYFVWEMHKV